ncbi:MULTISPECIES: c-type cytochrome [Methylomicrobium]|uniref:Cytochrome c553 n=1 Tax=Methylomicrobium album BG8 TaxID=686340 RepID=H8GG82_METAL|nr:MULTISPECIES: cytochrome c [Methylomicrobium]EIC30006.1 cytochrome c553 [Methylomicrobium album BG8]
MKALFTSGALMAGIFAAAPADAESICTGQTQAAQVCSHCHGVRTPSADAPFPPLAGRDVEYLQKALKEYRDKTRKSDIMNAIAGSLSDDDIADVAAYYAQQNINP